MNNTFEELKFLLGKLTVKCSITLIQGISYRQKTRVTFRGSGSDCLDSQLIRFICCHTLSMYCKSASWQRKPALKNWKCWYSDRLLLLATYYSYSTIMMMMMMMHWKPVTQCPCIMMLCYTNTQTTIASPFQQWLFYCCSCYTLQAECFSLV